jgi:hypothetical protein
MHKGFKGVFHRVEYFSPSLHTVKDGIPLPPDRFHTDVTELPQVLQSLDTSKKTLIIFDDMLWALKGPILKEFNKLLQNRRHLGCSIVIMAQVLNRIPLSMRKLFTHLVLFKTNNPKELQSIHEDQLSFLGEQHFYQVLGYAWRDDHDFIYVDVDRGRIWHNLTEEILLH